MTESGGALDLPPVERVFPGLWSIPVPIPDNPLRYVLVYCFETDRGLYLVDAGWDTEVSWKTLVDGLVTAGFGIGDVRGVLVTHIHPDHYGLAGRVREASGAWIALHPADAALITDRYRHPSQLLSRMGATLREAGAPEELLEQLTNAAMPMLARVQTVEPDVLLEDGDKPEVPGWDLVAIWTPGHSPGHLCFWDEADRIMLTGDHILPRITPNISLHPQSGDDPLGDYMRSLEKIGAYDAEDVLPAHEWRFKGLGRRADELIEHHEARLVEVLDLIASGSDTAWEIAAGLTWSRAWSEMKGFTQRAALGETVSHLRVLELRGRLQPLPGTPRRWALGSGS